jgi:hypothetical protein
MGTVVAAFTLVVAGCGGGTPPAETETTTGAPEASSAVDRVFFVSPKNGDTIKTTSAFEFGHEGVSVAAVPPGELTPEQVRARTIHHHLGVDTDCLPPGTAIPKADPWIHFGDGKNVIEMQLTPGPHTLALQAGDDMHRTISGLCDVISVTVVQ